MRYDYGSRRFLTIWLSLKTPARAQPQTVCVLGIRICEKMQIKCNWKCELYLRFPKKCKISFYFLKKCVFKRWFQHTENEWQKQAPHGKTQISRFKFVVWFLGGECLSHFTIAALKAGATCGPIKGCCIVEKAVEKLDLVVKHGGKSRKNQKTQKAKKKAIEQLHFLKNVKCKKTRQTICFFKKCKKCKSEFAFFAFFKNVKEKRISICFFLLF